MKPIEIIFDALMHKAVIKKCTDIHFNLKENTLIFRRHKTRLHIKEGNFIHALYSYLKYKAKIEMSSIVSTHTGSFQYVIEAKTYYLRFSILETLHQKHGVLRILNIVPIHNLKACGLNSTQSKSILNLFNNQHGLVLFCGKTGAGKSTTMFAALNEMVDQEIFTLENPIERYYESMIQIESKNQELNNHITQLLRHDPDILAIGEVRTTVELEAVIRAALSGHLITSTLHAGSIDEVFLRIQNLNFTTLDIQAILKGIVFQKVYLKEGEFEFEFEIIEL